jgi:hypothetical protein
VHVIPQHFIHAQFKDGFKVGVNGLGQKPSNTKFIDVEASTVSIVKDLGMPESVGRRTGVRKEKSVTESKAESQGRVSSGKKISITLQRCVLVAERGYLPVESFFAFQTRKESFVESPGVVKIFLGILPSNGR